LLVLRRDREEAENYQENEKIIDGERLLNEISRKELKSSLQRQRFWGRSMRGCNRWIEAQVTQRTEVQDHIEYKGDTEPT
jgi:hypothetical protein